MPEFRYGRVERRCMENADPIARTFALSHEYRTAEREKILIFMLLDATHFAQIRLVRSCFQQKCTVEAGMLAILASTAEIGGVLHAELCLVLRDCATWIQGVLMHVAAHLLG